MLISVEAAGQICIYIFQINIRIGYDGLNEDFDLLQDYFRNRAVQLKGFKPQPALR